MRIGDAFRRAHIRLLRRAIPALDEQDAREAAADFERLRQEAWAASAGAWIRLWSRELRALVRTAHDERQRSRRAFVRPRMRGQAFDALRSDLRQAARGLARQPLFAAAVVMMLAIGFGANGAAFALLDRLLLSGPEHVTAPDRLVRVYRRMARGSAGAETMSWLPYATYLHLRERARVFESMTAYGVRDTPIGTGASARVARVGMVLGPFFDVLGTAPARGRFFRATEDAASAGPLVVLSDELWRSMFGSSPSALGSTLSVDSTRMTITGVAPPGFSGAGVGRVDAWILGDSRNADAYNWKIVGRLAAQATPADATREVDTIHAQSAKDEPQWLAGAQLLTAPIRYDDTAREPAETQIARWMAAVALLLLLVTCANVANLLLVRLVERRRELGIRLALGSGRWRVLQLVGCEVFLLTAAAGLASAWIASLALGAGAHALFPDGVNWSASMDRRTGLWLAGLLTAGAAAITALLALQASRQPAADVLRSRDGVAHARLRSRTILIVVQAALSTVLLAGAGLFALSWLRIESVDLGTDADHVIVAELKLPHGPVPAGGAAFQRFIEDARHRERVAYSQALDAVRVLPGVASASLTLGLPFDNGSFSTTLTLPGREPIRPLPGGGPYISAVGTGYFATIGTRIVRGRAFDAGDTSVAIVSDTSARRLWPAGNALGQCVLVGDASGCATIVGIAQDAHRVSLREEPSLQVYIPYGQEHGMAGVRLLVRPDDRGRLPWSALRSAIVQASPQAQVVELRNLGDPLAGEMRPARLGMATFGASAVLALLASAAGLYGLMAYVVSSRRREIGIRLALGASASGIQRLVVGNALVVAGIGILIGLAGSVAGARWIQAQLFDTSPTDPRALGGTAIVLLAAAFAAGALPARRAMRISPAESMCND